MSAPVHCLAILMARVRGNLGFEFNGHGEIIDFGASRSITFLVLTRSRRRLDGFERLGLLQSDGFIRSNMV